MACKSKGGRIMENNYLELFDEFLDAIAPKESGISDKDYEAMCKIFTKYLDKGEK